MGTTLCLKDVYRGYYFDRDLGLYYLISRYYDPNTGRFISPDHISVIAMSPTELTDKNLYAYCDNNPIMRIDATGNSWTAVRIVAGAALNVLTSFLGSLVTGEEYTWKNVLWDAAIGGLGSWRSEAMLAASFLDGAGTFVDDYFAKEESFGTSLFDAATTVVFSVATVGNLTDLIDIVTKTPAVQETAFKVFSDIFVNLVFDGTANLLSASVSRAMTSKN